MCLVGAVQGIQEGEHEDGQGEDADHSLCRRREEDHQPGLRRRPRRQVRDGIRLIYSKPFGP